MLINKVLKDNNISKPAKAISIKNAIKKLIKNRCFVALNILVFLNNFIDMRIFYAVPQYLDSITGIDGMWIVFK